MIRVAIIALALSGCASQIMKGYVGQPLQMAMVDHGPPVNAFDMPDGTRAFQWVKKRSFVMPVSSYQSGNASVVGNTVWWTQNTRISGGQPIHSECAYTMFARWDEGANAWMLTGFQKPRWACE